MSRPLRTNEVRQLVLQTFLAMGAAEDCDLHETVLIRDGIYCGHRFAASTLQAVWFSEEDELKFYDASGHVAQILRPSEKLAVEQSSATARAA